MEEVGYGYGWGDGDGSGDGSGLGSGYGWDNGWDNGYGSGLGSGYGWDNGWDNGYGYGDGTGSGSGDGWVLAAVGVQAQERTRVKMRKYYSVKQVAEMFNVHAETLRRWIRLGMISPIKIGKSYKISLTDIEDLKKYYSQEKKNDR